ncbi:MAG: T9SS type A sorting domain-containing protein [Candidatus Latescibacteria bacterium]|nr:T9SS type A sorting domain-containing protein [bacterium]MBD3423648.1 T9SS type A sorting domain-containing protein [Candidatus Latescibacterota bacterium]
MKIRRSLIAAGLKAAAVMMIAGASITGGPAAASDEYAFITTTDYTTGSSSVIYIDESYSRETDLEVVGSDAISRWYGGLLYVVNRSGGDNIQILDPENDFSTTDQFSVGNGSNPQDIAFISATKAYVSRYDSNDLWIVNPSTGAHTGTIDLSSMADSDGLCEMAWMFMMDSTLFISIQRIDRDNYWLPAGTSYLAVVDCDADTLMDTDPGAPGTQPITLTYSNPFSPIQYNRFDGMLYLSCVGYFGASDGGVVVIDPATLSVTGTMITESEAGGDINDLEIYSPERGYAIVTNPSFNTDLVSFNPSTGLKGGTLYSPGDYVLNAIEISPAGELFLADQTATNPGIRIYSACDGEEITGDPIDTGLPPFDITFSGDVQTAAEEPEPPLALGQNYPNPFNPSTFIPFSMNRRGRVRAAVYDVSGRKVATLAERVFAAGANRLEWDGRDSRSRKVCSGVYFARVSTGSFTGTVKMMLIR